MKKEKCIGVIAGHSGDSITDKIQLLGYEVALAAGRGGEPGTDKAEYCLIADLRKKSEIEQFLRKHKVQYVLIGTGDTLALELADYLERKGYVLSIDCKNSFFAKDKVAFKKELINLGLVTPKYMNFYTEYVLDDISNNIGIPCVVKSSTDALQPKKANTVQELDEYINEIIDIGTEVLIEEYIRGCECTVPVLSDGITVKCLDLIYYNKALEYKLEGFQDEYIDIMSNELEEEIREIAIRIVKEMDFIGLVRVDFRVNTSIYILELNSIIVVGYGGSSYPFFVKKGIDIADVMVQNAMRIFENKVKL